MPDVAVLGVDIASARWADNGTAVLWVDRHAGVVTRVEPGAMRWPDAPLTPSALADAIHACAVRTGAVAVALDGPHAWRDPARSADEPGVGRRAEFAVRAQCKTGAYPRTYPGTQAAWTRFSIAVFDALLARPGVRMASPEDARAPVSAGASDGSRASEGLRGSAGDSPGSRRSAGDASDSTGYLLLESYPTAIWRAAALAPLPAKSRAPDVPAFYARLAEAFALPHAVVTSHDDLQAVVAALAAVGVTGVVGSAGTASSTGTAGRAVQARAHGEPARVVPHADGAHRVEGFIWDAAPLTRGSLSLA